MIARLAVLALALVATGCKDRERAIATLVEILSPSAERATGGSGWSAASAGARFRHGDAVRTSATGSARLELPGNAFLRMGADTTIRFTDDLLDVDGEIENVSKGPATFDLQVGATQLSRGGSIRVGTGDDGETNLEVLVGSAIVRSATGTRALSAGEQLIVRVGSRVLEVVEAADAGARPPAPDAAVASDPETPDPPAGDPQPAAADLIVVAGESAAIHDPGAPSAVRIRFADRCPRGGEVAVGSGRKRRTARGRRSVVLALGRGSHRYRVTCHGEAGEPEGKPVASGRLRVDRASGARPLPARPTKNTITANGMSYRIQYQNLLPDLTFAWPEAPGGATRLLVAPQGRSPKRYSAAGGRRTVKSGGLPEGRYRFWFEAGERRSKESNLVLAFDNASSSTYLRLPQVGGSWGSGPVRVAGAAVAGARVSVGDLELDLDRQQRFDARIARPSSGAVTVRVAHRRRGIHYYLRRDGKR